MSKIVFLYRDDFIHLFDQAINSKVFMPDEVIRVYHTWNCFRKSRASIGRYYVIEEFQKNSNNYEFSIDKVNDEIITLTDGEYDMRKVISNDRVLEFADPVYAVDRVLLYYNFWNWLFSKDHPNFIVNEIMSSMFAHIPEIVGRKYNVQYLGIYASALYVNRFMFMYGDKGDSKKIRYFYCNMEPNDKETQEASRFLDEFVKKRKVSHLESSLAGGFKGKLKQVASRLFFSRKHRSIFFDSFDYMNAAIRKNWIPYQFGLVWANWGKYSEVNFSKFDPDESIDFFYPFHVEPEGVLTYWTSGEHKKQIYTVFSLLNVFKLDRIHIKDHISSFGYRPVSDYKILNCMKRVVLLDNKVPAVEIIKKSKCVIVVSGTTGMEAFLLGKHVVALAQCHYSFVRSIKFVPDLKNTSQQELEDYLSTKIDKDNQDKIRYLVAFYKGSYDCKLDQWNTDEENGKKFAIGLKQETEWFIEKFTTVLP